MNYIVPEGEVNLGVLNGGYLESRSSEFKRQGPPGALSGHITLAFGGHLVRQHAFVMRPTFW
jgi:hypothetical protein